MFPEKFIRRIEGQRYVDPGRLLEALEEPSPVSIRINDRKWQKVPRDSEKIGWCRNGYYLPARPAFTFDPLFHSGSYYPQEASGMFLEQAFLQCFPRNSMRVLDLCGAPGGKSTHLSSLTGENGFLVANEVIRSRADVLAETITKWGLGNAMVTNNDPSAFGRLKGYFDIIVVDAPCSGEGMFRNKEVVGEWSEGNAMFCAERQKRILADVWPSLKTDGILIYSTCTFNPAENEHNVKWLTEKEDARSIRIDISGLNGITEIEHDGIMGYSMFPGKVRGEGFFLSVIRKTGREEPVTRRSKKISGLETVKKEVAAIARWSDFPVENLIRTGNEIAAIGVGPDEYQFLRENLRIIKSGTSICTVKNADYLPSHHLAVSSRFKAGSFPVADLDLLQSLEYLRRDKLSIENAPAGWFVIRYNGINLGFANNIGERINNYYPVEWRIRMKVPGNVTDSMLKW
jgi:16S rRNA C967 or C1407 C5-methylase (RsmB/RsmF family)/NOL1/NOP2/fmu family ribosome biogenesis protein